MYPLTKCTYCSEKSKIQPPGNGCHTCSKGYMKQIENDKETEKLIDECIEFMAQNSPFTGDKYRG